MLASPSIPQIASALALQPRATSRSASRILCLKLHDRRLSSVAQRAAQMKAAELKKSDAARKPIAKTRPMAAIVESFLKFSPRVQFRAPDWIFIDIASTSHFFRGEEGLVRAAQALARDLGFGVQCAVSDTAAGAQAFALAYGVISGPSTVSPSAPSRAAAGFTADGSLNESSSATSSAALSTPQRRQEFICPPGEEKEALKNLSLPLLLHLEGLEAWSKPAHIESVISFFMMLGLHSFRDLSRFTLPSFQERWGETGAVIWKRLNAQDKQVISPLHPIEALEDYMHLDFPVTLLSLLLHELQKSVDFLFTRLQGRRLLARKITLCLRCEYSKTQHVIEIEPQKPSRDQEMFMTLLENKLAKLDLSNPIRDFEFSVSPTAEQVQQFDFFEPRVEENSKLDALLNLLSQAKDGTRLQAGFYKIHPSVRPEKSWELSAEPTFVSAPQAAYRAKGADGFSFAPGTKAENGAMHVAHQQDTAEGKCGAGYGNHLPQAPRPTRLLRRPQSLSIQELQNLKILSRNPIERLEDDWWDETGMRRDYYFAVSPKGQCLWIYQNLRTNEYFLHGYFD